MRRTTETRVLLVLLLAAGGCSAGSSAPATDAGSEDAAVPCVTGLTTTCAATYDPPAFDTIFTNILQPNCSVGTGTCHTSDFGAGGIVFADAGAAYDTLLGVGGGVAYVLPDDPACSTLMKRLESQDPSYHMPRGTTFLSAGDLCTIVQWIGEGAAR